MSKLKIQENVYFFEVAKLLKENYIVSIFNGRSESGPRSLGNRSILFNPSFSDNKKRVNKIKGREHFRPLAASIIQNEVNEWFDIRNISESPFMTYSFKVNPMKKNLISSVIHVDDTCRLQTVSEHQNFCFFTLLKNFFDQTQIPLLGNTSFNLSGYPIVENIEDALETLYNSDIDFLYFPECHTIVRNER